MINAPAVRRVNYKGSTRTAIVIRRSGKWRWRVVLISSGASGVVSATLTDSHIGDPILYHGRGATYPVARAAKMMRESGRTHGITKRARHLLRGL